MISCLFVAHLLFSVQLWRFLLFPYICFAGTKPNRLRVAISFVVLTLMLSFYGICICVSVIFYLFLQLPLGGPSYRQAPQPLCPLPASPSAAPLPEPVPFAPSFFGPPGTSGDDVAVQLAAH